MLYDSDQMEGVIMMGFLSGIIEWNTLIGAIIGAGGSIFGGLWATRHNIKLQDQATTRNNQRSAKLSAEILYIDILGILKEMVYLSNTKPITNLGFGSHNSRYSDHIANLEGELNADELYAIHCLYGMIMKFQEITRIETSNMVDLARYEMYLNKLLEHFCKTVYGNKSNFVSQTQSLSINNFQIGHAKRSMLPEFKSVFDALERLKSQAP